MVAPDSFMETSKDRSSLKGSRPSSSSSMEIHPSPAPSIQLSPRRSYPLVQSNPESSTNGNNAGSSEGLPTVEAYRQPSYVALACCISGYSTLTYDSKRRQELKSRTSSPIRIDGPHITSCTSECSNFLTPVPHSPSSIMQTQGKGMDVLKGCGGSRSSRRGQVILPEDHRNNFNSPIVTRGCMSSYSISSSRCSSSSTPNSSLNKNEYRLITPTKLAEQISPSSFIVQRVERLYGPGALAQGFYASTRNGNNCSSVDKTPSSKPIEHLKIDESLPVLKLLNPQFRAQLTVTSRKPRASPKEVKSSDVEKDGKLKTSDTIDATVRSMKSLPSAVEEKDGHYFLKLYEEKVELLDNFALSAEKDLETCDIEECCGILRSASGKARLLIAQKLNQFKGLCQKNITQSRTDDFPTTNEDLAGFWDMVLIQVNDVVAQFQKINEMKTNDWNPPEGVTETDAQNGPATPTNSKKPIPKKPIDSKLKEASKARDEARRKLIEEKRRAMRENRNKEDTVILL